jgi:hypothetical protein
VFSNRKVLDPYSEAAPEHHVLERRRQVGKVALLAKFHAVYAEALSLGVVMLGHTAKIKVSPQLILDSTFALAFPMRLTGTE